MWAGRESTSNGMELPLLVVLVRPWCLYRRPTYSTSSISRASFSLIQNMCSTKDSYKKGWQQYWKKDYNSSEKREILRIFLHHLFSSFPLCYYLSQVDTIRFFVSQSIFILHLFVDIMCPCFKMKLIIFCHFQHLLYESMSNYALFHLPLNDQNLATSPCISPLIYWNPNITCLQHLYLSFCQLQFQKIDYPPYLLHPLSLELISQVYSVSSLSNIKFIQISP